MVRTSLVIFLALPTLAEGAVLTVGPGQPYATVQGAIDAAANGDRIEVEAGTYTENLTLSKDVEVIGLSGAASTFLDGNGTVMVTVDAATVTFEGFTLDNTAQRGMEVLGNATVVATDIVISNYTLGGGFEAAALMVLNSDVTFTDSVFNDNFADDQGGAVAVHDSIGSFTNCTFNRNESNEDGGALGIYNSTVTLDTCTFDENLSDDDGGAMDVDDASDVTVVGSLFSNNSADDAGGAITSEDGGSLTVDNCVFLNNSTPSGGGAIRARRDLNLTVNGGVFEGNDTFGGYDPDGGAINLGDGVHEINDAVFLNNASESTGGAVRAGGTTEITITGADFSSNEAPFGGALYIRGDTIADISGTTFDLNESVGSNPARGGGIRWFPTSGSLSVSNSQFTNNDAETTGGAISAATQGGYGGGIGSISLIGNVFIGNTTDSDGGALYAIEVDELEIRGNTFCGNTAGNNGGASVIEDGGGGANTWDNNVVADNAAVGSGGGIQFSQSGDPDMVNNTFLGNDSADGGHMRISAASGNLTNNIFAFAPGGNGLSQGNNNGTRDHNLWFGNVNNDVGGMLVAGDLGNNAVFLDPSLTAYAGDCFTDDYTLQGGSPAIDAGDPAILDGDGTTSDIGAYGGPNAPIDEDGDGYTSLVDCYDANAAVNPGATEICDGIDNDCDGEGDGSDAVDAGLWYPDLDGDGYGDGDEPLRTCTPPTDHVAVSGDCDDDDATTYDGAYEACDGVDNNCDGEIDDGQPMTTYYADRDGDGYGDETSEIQACAPPDGYVENTEDCDDFEPLAWTNNVESCDEIDNDCDGEIDEGALITWYEDGDGDGYGVDGDDTFEACEGDDGFADNATDCDDTESSVNPGAEEICDELDNDCDGEVNEDIVVPWYEDADEDGFGNDEVSQDDCEEPPGFTEEGGDCDDTDPFINPDAEDDSKDQIDQNCDDMDGTKFAEEDLKITPDCGCDATSSGSSMGWMVLIAGLLGVRRRR